MPDYTTKVIFDTELRAGEAIAEANRLRKAFDDLARAGEKTPGGATPQKLPWLDQLSKDIQAAEIQYFGLRRLSYGLQSTGRDFTNSGMSIIRTMQSMADQYLEVADASARAAIAMQLPLGMMDDLRKSVQASSAEIGVFSTTEILEQLRRWVAGTGEVIKSQQDLDRALATVSDVMLMAGMDSMDLGKAVDYVGAAMSTFSLSIEDVPDIVAKFHYVAAGTRAEVSDLGEALKLASPYAVLLGVSLDDLLVALGSLADFGLKGSIAGTSIGQFLHGLTGDSKEASEALDKLFRTSNEGWKDIIWPKGEFVGMAETFDLLAAATENYTEEQKTAAFTAIFTARGLRAAALLVQEAAMYRAEGINAQRAQQKLLAGEIDAEVLKYLEVKEAFTGMQQSISSALERWTTDVATWATSDSAQAQKLAQRWRNAITDLGAVVFEEGIGPVEDLVKAFEKLAQAVEENPALVEGGIKLGITAVEIGAVTTALGIFLQALANVLIITTALKGTTLPLWLKSLPYIALAYSMTGEPPIVSPAYDKYAEGAWKTFEEQYEYMPTVGQWRNKETGEYLHTLEEINEVLADIIQQEELWRTGWGANWVAPAGVAGLAPILKEWADPWALEAAARTAKEAALLQKYGPPEEQLPGVTPAFEAEALAPPTLEELEKKYGAVLDAYDKYLEQLESKQKAFDKGTLTMEEDHQEALVALAESRAEGRIDVIDAYDDRVEDTWRSFYRSMELAERDHQERMQDIIEDGVERRADIIEAQVERLADTVAAYELSVSDAWEAYYYDEALAAEDAAYRRQAIIDDYNEWEKEQLEALSEEKVDETEDLNKRLLNLNEDYLRDLERGREDYLDRMMDLIAKRDARAMLNEIRDFAKWLKRREEDYLRSKERTGEVTQESFEQEREERKRNLAEELAEFDAAEQRRQEKAKKAFERRLFLMERAHKRELVTIEERNAEELKDLAETIAKREKAEKDAYAKTLVRMKEAHEYQLGEMKREHTATLKEYDVETQEKTDKLKENHDKVMAKRKALHEIEMDELREEAKDVLEDQYDALAYDDAKLEAIFYERLQKFLKYLGRELDIVSDYYAKRVSGMAEVWAGTVPSSLGIAGAPYAAAAPAASSLGIAGAPYAAASTAPAPSAAGIAGAPYATSTAPSTTTTAAQGTYTVKAGDTLGEIAKRYGVAYVDIARASGIADPNLIHPGQVLTIPGAGGVAAAAGIAGVPAAPAPTTTTTAAAAQGSYTVKSGDTLGEIAKRYGVSYTDIARASGISDPNRIYPGQVLVIPGAGGAAAPSSTQASRGAGTVPYEDLFRAAGEKYGVDWRLLAAQAGWETGYTYDPGIPEAGGRAPGLGLGQFMPATWQEYAPGAGYSADLATRANPEAAIYTMAAYMAAAQKYLGTTDPRWLSLAYNMGMGGASRLSSLSAAPAAQQRMIAAVGAYKMETGGLVTQPGIYALAERGPELVLPADWTKKIMQSRSMSIGGRGVSVGTGLSVTVRQDNWRFEGSFTDADKRWFRNAAEQAAYIAVDKVVQEAASGR